MKNKFVLFLAHLITTIIATVILIASIKSLIGNISLQKKIVKANAQTLQSEVNAPAYFQLRGITMLTPAMITNYDQKFGTNLRSKITWQSSGTHVEKKESPNKKMLDYFDEKTGVRSPKLYQSQSHPPEAVWPAPLKSLLYETVSLSVLKESASKSKSELETLQKKGVLNYLLSLNIIIPGTGMTIGGMVLLAMGKKLSEDCYLGIKWLFKQIWNLILRKKTIRKKSKKE